MYILLRDKLTFGQIEAIMKSHINDLNDDTVVFEDENMAKYAIDLIDRLTVK